MSNQDHPHPSTDHCSGWALPVGSDRQVPSKAASLVNSLQLFEQSSREFHYAPLVFVPPSPHWRIIDLDRSPAIPGLSPGAAASLDVTVSADSAASAFLASISVFGMGPCDPVDPLLTCHTGLGFAQLPSCGVAHLLNDSSQRLSRTSQEEGLLVSVPSEGASPPNPVRIAVFTPASPGSSWSIEVQDRSHAENQDGFRVPRPWRPLVGLYQFRPAEPFQFVVGPDLVPSDAPPADLLVIDSTPIPGLPTQDLDSDLGSQLFATPYEPIDPPGPDHSPAGSKRSRPDPGAPSPRGPLRTGRPSDHRLASSIGSK